MTHEKIIAIKNEHERQFASIFFDHDEWTHHPEAIIFKGGRYTADFFDARRDIYIEVVGTRQAFSANRYKYMYLLEVRPEIKLEFRSYKGNLLNLYNFSLRRYGVSIKPSREEIYYSTGIMPVGYEDIFDCIEPLKKFLIATNWKQIELIKKINIPYDYIPWSLRSEDRDPKIFLIKSKYAEKIRSFLREWDEHPENFPARRGYATMYTRKILSKNFSATEYYCPVHPTGTYFDETLPKRRGRCRRSLLPDLFQPPEAPHAD